MRNIPNKRRIASSARRTLIHGWVIFFHYLVFFSPAGCRHYRPHRCCCRRLRCRRRRRCYVRTRDCLLIAISLPETINYCDKKWRPSSPQVKYRSILHGRRRCFAVIAKPIPMHTTSEWLTMALTALFWHRNSTLNLIQWMSVAPANERWSFLRWGHRSIYNNNRGFFQWRWRWAHCEN